MASVGRHRQTTTATCVARSEPLTGIACEALSGAAVKLAVLRDRVAPICGWFPEAATYIACNLPPRRVCTARGAELFAHIDRQRDYRDAERVRTDARRASDHDRKRFWTHITQRKPVDYWLRVPRSAPKRRNRV